MSTSARVRSLTAYVVSRLADMEASFGKTKLVKLLYLIDVESYRRWSRKMSGLDWVFYHYGPYAFEIDDILKQLDLDIPQEDVTTLAGRRAIAFRPHKNAGAEFEAQCSGSEKLVVDRVLREWGMEELNPILSYVYFHTEPMKGARREEALDFSKIQKIPVQLTMKPGEGLSTEGLKELRAEFQKARASRLKQVRKALSPEPRLDDVFWHNLAHLDTEETYSVPRGEIELAEEFKGQLREEAELE